MTGNQLQRGTGVWVCLFKTLLKIKARNQRTNIVWFQIYKVPKMGRHHRRKRQGRWMKKMSKNVWYLYLGDDYIYYNLNLYIWRSNNISSQSRVPDCRPGPRTECCGPADSPNWQCQEREGVRPVRMLTRKLRTPCPFLQSGESCRWAKPLKTGTSVGAKYLWVLL